MAARAAQQLDRRELQPSEFCSNVQNNNYSPLDRTGRPIYSLPVTSHVFLARYFRPISIHARRFLRSGATRKYHSLSPFKEGYVSIFSRVTH